MLVEWDVPIKMDDGLVLRADVFRPDDDEPHPVLFSYGPYGKDLAFPGRLPRRLDERWSKAIRTWRRGRRNRFQAWEVCDPEKWVPDGYICVRVDARGWGRSPGYIDHVRDAGHPGLVRLHRVGGRPAVEHRQSRPARHQLLRDHAVAGGRHLTRPHLTAMVPWEGVSDFYRDMFYHGGMLCQAVDVWYRRTDQHRAAWPGRTQLRQRRTPGSSSPVRRHSPTRNLRPTAADYRRRRAKPSARRRFSSGALGGVRPDHGAVPVGGQLGRAGAAPPRQRRGVRAGGLEPEMAGDPRPRALDRVLHRLRNRFAEAVFRPLPQRHRQRLGPPATGHAADPHRRRRLHRPHRKRMAHRPHPVDDLAPRPRRGHPLARPACRAPPKASFHRTRRPRHHHDHPADRPPTPRSPARSRPPSTCPPPPPTPTSSPCCGCSTPTATKSSSKARSTRTPPSDRAGYAPPTANSTPP